MTWAVNAALAGTARYRDRAARPDTPRAITISSGIISTLQGEPPAKPRIATAMITTARVSAAARDSGMNGLLSSGIPGLRIGTSCHSPDIEDQAARGRRSG